jgi:hypothetical protein
MASREARGARRGGAAADKASPEFWRAVKTGDFVSLADTVAFAEALAAGAPVGGSGVDYAVGEIRDFALRGPGGKGERAGQARASLGTYRFIELAKEGSGPLYLTLVDSADRFELRLYYMPAGLEGGTRDELIDRGDTWLFLPPPDPEDFISSELEYAPYPDVPEIDEDGTAKKFLFSRAGAGSLYCEALDTGAPAIIAEYEAEAEPGTEAPAHPLLLVLEEGWMRPDGSIPEEGGFVTVMLGKVMSPGDLDCYPA